MDSLKKPIRNEQILPCGPRRTEQKMDQEYELFEAQTQFVRHRITQLRMQKNISEYQMSYDLGHSRGYIYNISAGKALPTMHEFFNICDYFGITPEQFFDREIEQPCEIQQAAEQMKRLSKSDLRLVLDLLTRLTQK